MQKNKKQWLTAKDLVAGTKRINLTIDATFCSKIAAVSTKKGLPPATYLKLLVHEQVENDFKHLNPNELPGQTNLFNKKGKKYGIK